MLFSGLILVSRMRLSSLVGMFRFQSLMLAGIAFIAGTIPSIESEILLIAVLVLTIKVILIPMAFLRIRKNTHTTERLESYVRPTPTTLLAILAVGISIIAGSAIVPFGETFVFAVIALSLILFGLLLLVVRMDMYGQAIGFLVMENGLYTFGLMFASDMPFFVEISLVFDVLIVFILIFSLIRRAHLENASADTAHLRELID